MTVKVESSDQAAGAGVELALREGDGEPLDEPLDDAEGAEPLHDGYRVVEPMRPDLAPGQSVTYVPDRYCQKCQQARGVKRCPICGDVTVMREDLSEETEVRLPELPPTASLNLPLERSLAEGPSAAELQPAGPALEAATAAAAAHAGRVLPRRRVLDALPPPDPEDELEPEAREIEPPARARSTMLERGLAARRAQEGPRARVLDLAAAKRVLDAAAEEAAPAVANGRGAQPRLAANSSILDFGRSGRTNGSPLASGRRAMLMETSRTRAREREVDDGGREVHRPTNGRRARSLEEQLILLWADAKIDKAAWVKFAAAYAHAGEKPEDAADLADQLYMQLLEREHLANTAR